MTSDIELAAPDLVALVAACNPHVASWRRDVADANVLGESPAREPAAGHEPLVTLALGDRPQRMTMLRTTPDERPSQSRMTMLRATSDESASQPRMMSRRSRA